MIRLALLTSALLAIPFLALCLVTACETMPPPDASVVRDAAERDAGCRD